MENFQDKQVAANEFLAHIRANRDSVGELLQYDSGYIRNEAANRGVELTPSECEGLLKILKYGYDMVGGSDTWSDFLLD